MKYTSIFLFCFMSLHCLAQKQSPVAPLTGSYTISSMKDQKKFFRMKSAASKVTIDQNGETLKCNLGCNSISGTFVVSADEIEEIELVSTEKFCSSKLQKLERKFLQNMKRINHYKYAKRQLSLYDGEELLMVLRKK